MSKQLYIQCLNREFDAVLSQVRKTPLEELGHNFLQLYLAKSCQYAHAPSVVYLWNKFVLNKDVLVIKPELLCDMGSIALHSGHLFMPPRLLVHYNRHHTPEGKFVVDPYSYELSRIKVESFAKGTATSKLFKERWKVFLEDIDNKFPLSYNYRIRDYMYLADSIKSTPEDKLTHVADLLFQSKKLLVKNPSSMSLLLNIILTYQGLSISHKVVLFEEFLSKMGAGVQLDDTVSILVDAVQSDRSQLIALMRLLRNSEVSLSNQLKSKINRINDSMK
ncbi:Uncharacterized protein RNJ44_03386 [Nakaseomyces bracarensis]|uniref:Uncharacterized protein n=1 Tax=Nakaseomyces bracarensis TaxID=273131 RepID=A0ABR4NZM3_9SACH